LSHHVIEFDYKCQACKGTGLYKGLAEGEGFGVVCYRCNGTGRAHFKFEYDDFIKRIKRNDVKQVLEVNPGIVAGFGENKQFTLDSFGGIRYEDWFKGKPFPPKSEMRQFTCPAWWYQSANYNLKPEWCDEYGFGFGSFSSCARFSQKELCWARFDKEHPELS
jgi:hypothetical protein